MNLFTCCCLSTHTTPYFLIFTLFACPFPFRNFLYAFSFFFGTLMTAFLWIPLNAFFPTDFFVRDVDAILMVFRFLQPANAFAPIVLMFLLIVTVFSYLFPLHAFFAMDVTL